MSNDFEVADKVVAYLKQRGAHEVSAVLDRNRSVNCEVRDQRVEKLEDSLESALRIGVYVDGRFSAHTTNDLTPASLTRFLDRAVAMTKLLEADPFRKLPDPKYYRNRPSQELGLFDATEEQVTTNERKALAMALEASAHAGGDGVASVTSSSSDSFYEVLRVTSNGFRDRQASTSFSAGASVTMKDGEKRPEDGWYASARQKAGIPLATELGQEANRRARARIGAKKIPGGAMLVLVENRAAPRLLASLLDAATGANLQQKRSFLDGKLGQAVAAPLLTVHDDPLLNKGLGSRRFDGEGLSAKPMVVFEKGVLRHYYIDSYYGLKLGFEATTGSFSNVVMAPGARDTAALVSAVTHGLVVTSFLGGNSNSLTGDFSLGVQGYLVEGGKPTQPVAEMNLSGNHLSFWQKLAEASSDPHPYSAFRVPSLLFDGVSIT